LATGNPATFAYTGNDPLQTLNCNACHTSVDPLTPTRRVALAFTATWGPTNSVTALVKFPDAGDSNLCIRCHSVRSGAGANITNTQTTTAHLLPAATIVFGGSNNPATLAGIVTITATANGGFALTETLTGGGYEFASQIYTDNSTHKTIGIPVAPALPTTGPCVGCHMSGTAGHTWNAVTHNEVTGEVTAINSSACSAVGCHDGVTQPLVTPAALNAFKATFKTALDALEAQLNARGIFFNPADGRFYKSATDFITVANRVDNAYYASQAAQLPALTGATPTRDLQGAAYNFWLFKFSSADHAGYVHNTFYSRKLIADSADLLNDGTINGL
jgi:hypothetical protein